MTAALSVPGGAAVELKADGSFSARASTFSLLDRHSDVVVPGAWPVGQRVSVSRWNHSLGEPAAGEGRLAVDGDKGLVKGRLFLDRPEGRWTYRRLKELGSAAQWSYAFSIISSELVEHDDLRIRLLHRLAVYETSPVDSAASINTALLDLKAHDPGGYLGWAWAASSKCLVGPDGRRRGPFSPARPSPLEAAAKLNGITVQQQRELASIHAGLVAQEVRALERQVVVLEELGAMRSAFAARWGGDSPRRR